MVGGFKDTPMAAGFQFANTEKDATNSIVLFIAPFFPKFIKGFRMETGMDILVRSLGFVLDSPINFFFIAKEEVKNGTIGALDGFPIANDFKCDGFIKVVPEPGFIIASMSFLAGGDKQAGFGFKAFENGEVFFNQLIVSETGHMVRVCFFRLKE